VRIGRITREHGDIEFWLERVDDERSKAVLVGAGATALMTQPPAEACEFTWDGSTSAPLTLTASQTDRSASPTGDGPTGYSFADEPATLDGMPVLAMSVSGVRAFEPGPTSPPSGIGSRTRRQARVRSSRFSSLTSTSRSTRETIRLAFRASN